MGLSRKEVQDIIERTLKNLYTRKDYKKELKLLEETLKGLEESSDEYYEVILKLSRLYRYHKNYIEAEDILKEAIPKAKNFDKDLHLASIYRSLSFIKLQEREFSEARNLAKKGLSIVKYMRGFKAEKTKANIYAVLGNIYFDSKDYDDAIENYKKALKKSEDIGFQPREITVKNDLANVYIEQNKLEQAKELLLSIRKNAKENYKHAVPQIILRLARIEYEQNNYDQSKEYIKEAIDMSEDMGWKRSTAEAREALARIYEKEKKDRSKSSELKKAYKLYKELGLKKKAKKIEKQL
jgi:tetratricopeptide (TPR) repeat protein